MNVIGSLLIGGKRAFTEVCGRLRKEHFYSPLYAECYQTISETQFRDGVIDLPVLKDKLIAKGFTEQEIGQQLISGMEIVISATNISANAEVVIANWKAREADAIVRAYEPIAEGIDKQVSVIASKLNSLTRGDGGRDTQIVSDFLFPIYENFFNDRDPRTVFTGFSAMDRLLNGTDPTDYVLIAARPGIGKTAFALNLIRNMVAAGKKPTLFTLEMSKAQVVERMIAMLSNISLSTIRDRKEIRTNEVTQRFIEQAADKLNKYPLYINDSGALNTLDVMREMSSHDTDVIIIDHIGLMQGIGKQENRNQEVSRISRELRMLALQKQIPIVALCQLNRANETRGNKKPILSDLRDSGSLEQDACQIIFLSQYDQVEEGVYAEVAKNRQGANGGVVFRFDGSTQKFYETTARYEEAAKANRFKPLE